MSLARILEPEVMDSAEEALDYDQMDHRAVNERFVEDLLAAGMAGRNEETVDVLDLGTGTAQIPVLLCRRNAACRVMAADAAISMLELARYNIEVESLIERIQLTHLDAKRLSFSEGMFDVVMSNSIVHHIPEPGLVLSEAVRVTRPGGTIFFRDLLRPTSEEILQQLVTTYAGEANDHQRKMFSDSLHAALSLDEIQALVVELGFEASTVQATSDRHWTWSAVKPEANP